MTRRPPLGQHFLRDERALAHIAKQLDAEGETVLEVGAGHGELTKHLARRAARVVALEIDPLLCRELRANTSRLGNVEVACGDALEHDLAPYRFFAGNLPYEISSPLLFRLLDTKFAQAVFLLQREFAERLAAPPGTADWSRLSAMAQSRAEVSLLGYVGPERFSPPPRVASALVLLTRRPRPLPLDGELVGLLFQHKNQAARNALAHSARALGLSKEAARSLAERLPHADLRPRQLTLEQLEEMSRAFRRLRA